MKRKIACEVVYPVHFQIEIDDELPDETVRDLIKRRADELFECSSTKSVILHCSDEKYQER